MPTFKKRVNIVLPKDVEIQLIKIAQHDDVPVAQKALEFLKAGMELEEDVVWNTLAEKRAKKKAKYYSHDQAWS